MSDVHPATPLGSPRPDDDPHARHLLDYAPPPPATPAPGQAAYEAWAAIVAPHPWRWDQLDGTLRAAWDVSAQAAITAGTGRILAQAARYKHERDEARAQLAKEDADFDARLKIVDELIAERDALQRQLDARNRQLAELQTPGAEAVIAGRANARAVVAEMLSVMKEHGEDNDQIARWRKRAGLRDSAALGDGS